MSVITILHGRAPEAPSADFTVVVDVLRAFTTAHVAFQRGAPRVYLIRSLQEAQRIRERTPGVITAAESNGHKLAGADFGNSPFFLANTPSLQSGLALMTTNGVEAVLNAAQSSHGPILAASFANARATARWILDHSLERDPGVNLICSSASADEDLACAEYIRAILVGNSNPMPHEVRDRIRASKAAQKFNGLRERHSFPTEDLDACSREETPGFAMIFEREHLGFPCLRKG